MLSAFQVGTFIPTYRVEQKALFAAETYIQSYPGKNQEFLQQNYIRHYLDSIGEETIFSIPFIADYSYADLKSRQLRLGLDLQVGMEFTIGFETEANLEKMEQTKTLLSQRLNYLGLAQTQITTDYEKQQLHIEVPGVTNAERLRDLITKEAKLEFWHLYRVTDGGVLEGLKQGDERLRSK